MAITADMARAELARRELAKRQSMRQPDSEQQQQQGIGSIPEDVGNAGLNFLMGAGDKAMQIPGEAQEAGEQFIHHPFSAPPRAAQNVLSGLLEGGKQLFNFPLNVNTYLGSKGIPPFKQTAALAEKLKIGDTGLQKAVMGEPQKGDQLWQDVGGLLPLAMAPESIAGRVPAVTSKGILAKLSKEKAKQLNVAKQDYANLFKEAATSGVKDAIPSKSVIKNVPQIVKNSTRDFHGSLKTYMDNPSVENAHWAQSELGGFIRHLDKIKNRNGLTPSQIKTYKAAQDAQKGIKEAMFSNNAFGKKPGLALKYDNLSKKYRENVIPYTSLQDLSEFEAGKLRPKTAVKNLLNDEEFMIKLAKKNPGIYLHTPTAKRGAIGAAGLLGYDELKRLINGR